MNHSMLHAAARALAGHGMHGDSLIAHIDPREVAMLKAAGGVGTRNPHDGLLQFYGSDVGGPSTHDVGGPGNIGGGAGARADAGARSSGEHGGGAMGGSSGGYNSISGVMAKSPITGEALARQQDYGNVGNSALDNFGNLIASALGFNEIDPTKTNQKALAGGTLPGMQADWGFDPAGLIGGGIGTAMGVPGLGVIADLVSRKLGRPLESNVGPNVFGGGGGSLGAGGAIGAAGHPDAGAGGNGGGFGNAAGGGRGPGGIAADIANALAAWGRHPGGGFNPGGGNPNGGGNGFFNNGGGGNNSGGGGNGNGGGGGGHGGGGGGNGGGNGGSAGGNPFWGTPTPTVPIPVVPDQPFTAPVIKAIAPPISYNSARRFVGGGTASA